MLEKISLDELDLKDALDLAILIELEAQERYEEFARQVGTSRSDDAGAFFLQMIKNEATHAKDLKKKRKELFGEQPTRMNLEKYYQFQDIEAPEFDRAHSFMSARQALEVALASEIKAHDFFERAEKFVQNEEVKKLFNELKEEELMHQMLVRDILKTNADEDGPEVDKDEVDEPSGL